MNTSLFNIGRPPTGARRAVVAGFLTAFALLGPLGSAQVNQQPASQKPQFEGPRIRIQQTEKDFGMVTRGEVLAAEFVLENIGSEPLRILQAKPG